MITAPPSPLLFSFQKQPPPPPSHSPPQKKNIYIYILQSSCSKISKNSIGNICGGFLFQLQGIDLHLQKLNCAAYCTWNFGILNFSKYFRLITVTKRSHRRCSIKKLFLKIPQYFQENTCVAVSFQQSCRPSLF